MPDRDRTPLGGLPIGTPVRGRFTKWGGARHWEWNGRYVGEDEFGHWWYAAPGTRCTRPGHDFVEVAGWVSLMPRDRAWAASFYPETKEISVYVDMTTVPEWRPRDSSDGGPEWEVTMVDLDLDIVLTREGDLFVDDEDEFAEHQVELGYPAEVIALAEAAAVDVHAAIASGAEPFASLGHARLTECLANPAFALPVPDRK